MTEDDGKRLYNQIGGNSIGKCSIVISLQMPRCQETDHNADYHHTGFFLH